MQELRTPIEKIKAFHSVKGYLSQEEQSYLQKKLNIQDEDLKRLSGLEIETEFIFMIYMLGVREIVGFEEGIARLTGVTCPDLYVELNNNKRILIEIKESNINITNIGMQKYIAFAKKLNIDSFYIATKQNGLWALYHSDYVVKRKPKKINWQDDYKNSQMEEVFGDITYFMPNGLKFECIYNNTLDEKSSSKYEDFGSLESLSITYKNKIIIETQDNRKADFLCFMLEALITACANSNHNIEKLTLERTKVTDELDIKNANGIYISLSNFLLEPVYHTIKPFGEKYDFSSFLKTQYSKKQNIQNFKKRCLECLENLINSGYPIVKVSFKQ